MKHAGHPDCFVVINGPEDGAEFPVGRTPVYIGADPHCAVNLRLDADIKPYHARVTVVSDGYRIRSIGGAPVFVDGKRVGTLQSRVVRDGDRFQAGNTLLALECAPDGLASRSRGMASESDFVWLARQVGEGAVRSLRWTLRFSYHAGREAVRHWKFFTLLGAVAAYFVYRPFQNGVNMVFGMIWRFLQGLAS